MNNELPNGEHRWKIHLFSHKSARSYHHVVSLVPIQQTYCKSKMAPIVPFWDGSNPNVRYTRNLFSTCTCIVKGMCSHWMTEYGQTVSCCICAQADYSSFTLSPFIPTFFGLWQKWVYQSVQHHTGLTHRFYFLTFGHSGAQDWAPECPNVRN